MKLLLDAHTMLWLLADDTRWQATAGRCFDLRGLVPYCGGCSTDTIVRPTSRRRDVPDSRRDGVPGRPPVPLLGPALGVGRVRRPGDGAGRRGLGPVRRRGPAAGERPA